MDEKYVLLRTGLPCTAAERRSAPLSLGARVLRSACAVWLPSSASAVAPPACMAALGQASEWCRLDATLYGSIASGKKDAQCVRFLGHSSVAAGVRDCEGDVSLTCMQNMLRPRRSTVAVRLQTCMDILLKGNIAQDHTDRAGRCSKCRAGYIVAPRSGQQADMTGALSCCPAAHQTAQGAHAPCDGNTLAPA